MTALGPHLVRGESHIQCKASWEVAATSFPFCNWPHRLHVLFVKVSLARPSHPGHSTAMLRLESTSDNCVKLHTVEASKNRDCTSCSFYYYLFAPHIIWMMFFSHTSFVVNRTFNTTLLKGCNTCSKVELGFWNDWGCKRQVKRKMLSQNLG